MYTTNTSPFRHTGALSLHPDIYTYSSIASGTRKHTWESIGGKFIVKGDLVVKQKR